MMATAMHSLPDENFVIFASGVADSGEIQEEEYDREKNLLLEALAENNSKKMIYFSSYVAADGVSRYASHKREIEKILVNLAEDFLVLRLPQVVGPANNRTLVNYLVQAAALGMEISIQNGSYRNLIDVSDVVRILAFLIRKNISREVVSIGPAAPLSIFEIVKTIESILGREIYYESVEGGDRQSANLKRLKEIIGADDFIFEDDYQFMVLKKYVPLLFDKASVDKRIAP